MGKITVTMDTDLHKVVPLTPSTDMLEDYGTGYSDILGRIPGTLPGVVVHSGEPAAFATQDGFIFYGSEPPDRIYKGLTELFTHPPAQPESELLTLLDKAASLMTEAALSEDGADPDQMLDCVASIRGTFADIGKTTLEAQFENLWEQIRVAAGFAPDDEFSLSKAVARLVASAQPDTEAIVRALLDAAATCADEWVIEYVDHDHAPYTVGAKLRAIDKQAIIDAVTKGQS